MLTALTLLTAAASALALSVPGVNQRDTPICYNGAGSVTVMTPISNEVLGTLGADLFAGRFIITGSDGFSPTALSGTISCPGVQSVFVQNANPATYEAIAAAAVYNTTMAVGSPNWAILTTSPRTGPYTGAVNLGNAWTDANSIPAPTKSNMFTFEATSSSTIGNLSLSWTNPDGSTVPLYAFASNDGMLLGVTADLTAFEAVMGYDDETPYATYVPVIFQMTAYPYY